ADNLSEKTRQLQGPLTLGQFQHLAGKFEVDVDQGRTGAIPHIVKRIDLAYDGTFMVSDGWCLHLIMCLQQK
ncbi:MAG: hypothetical protein R6W96_07985, partial [Clostridia bacterium]